MWITPCITSGKVGIFPAIRLQTGISTQLFRAFSSFFHAFLREKNINLLILHQNLKLWITAKQLKEPIS